MIGKQRFLSFLFFLFLTGALSAQTARMIDDLLEVRAVSFETACAVVLAAAGLAVPDPIPDAAYKEAFEMGALPESAEPDAAIKLGQLSFLIMKAFNMKSGFWYALFPGPRYAYRELTYRKILQGRNDPSLTVSGERLLLILGRTLDYTGADR
ncbi:MAG: hypothetical protein LBR99_03865 [Treponema sp.]|jgi:hypothetical protein|nr:hypothetical protein [Treponema sp.]